MHKKLWSIMLAITAFFIFTPIYGYCYRIPTKESNIRYLYVFGENGKKSYGAKKEPQIVFLKVPDTYKGNIEIAIYDPDVGGYIDEKSGKWDTETRFSIFGGENAYSSIAGISMANIKNFEEGNLLDAKTFSEDSSYDKAFYHFSPIDASQGEKIGNHRYFKIIAEGLKGDDNNVFNLDVSPDVVEAFSYSLSLRLSEKRGAKMSLYPDIPSNATSIIEYNYDLDKTGGEIEIISASRSYNIKGSGTGAWENTRINFSPNESGRRWVYEITKDSQPNANMATYITTGDGKAVAMFFTPGQDGPKRVFVETPVVEKQKEEPWMKSKLSCNTFSFDGSKSYDPDKQTLTYFWDFGDGTTSDQLRPMHTYKDAGKYLVKLTVTDNSDVECNTATTQQVVKVNQPPCAIADGPDITCVNDEIIFDGSMSTDSPEDKLTYKWNFGDGETAEGPNVRHKYKKGGDYQVTLTVVDDSETMCDTGVDRLKVSVNTAPVADAGKDAVICTKNPNDPLEVTFDASHTKDADGHELTYIWDFGDGNSKEGKVVTHTYEKGGEYIAKLLVKDNTSTACDSSVATKLVTLNRAPMADAGENMKICITEKAEFDGSSSFDKDGDSLVYTWDFGDGRTAKGKNVSHRYAKGGTYKATLNIDDGRAMGCSSSSSTVVVDVNSTPNADINAEDVSCVGKSVKFDGSLSADPDGDRLNYTWDFGDGTTASGANTKHSYEKGGLYKVTLFVDDGKESDCSGSTQAQYVTVNTAPVAEAGGDLLVCVEDEVEFDASKSYDPDNDNLVYSWDFGDGNTAEGPKVRHAYKDIGIYKVVLMVKDDSETECNTATDALTATVNAEPIPIIEVM